MGHVFGVVMVCLVANLFYCSCISWFDGFLEDVWFH